LVVQWKSMGCNIVLLKNIFTKYDLSIQWKSVGSNVLLFWSGLQICFIFFNMKKEYILKNNSVQWKSMGSNVLLFYTSSLACFITFFLVWKTKKNIGFEKKKLFCFGHTMKVNGVQYFDFNSMDKIFSKRISCVLHILFLNEWTISHFLYRTHFVAEWQSISAISTNPSVTAHQT